MIQTYTATLEIKDNKTSLQLPSDWVPPIVGLTPEQATDVKRAIERAFQDGVRAGISECMEGILGLQRKPLFSP